MVKLQITAAAAKQIVLDGLARGLTVEASLKEAGRSSVKTHENWRASDPEYARKVDDIRTRRTLAKEKGSDPDLANIGFIEWRERFLGRKTYAHQHQWIDVLEGREPRDIHSSITYQPGRATRLLINTPPFHAKSTVITQEYVTYRICKNPNTRVIIVSKTLGQATKFLHSIKTMLTSPHFLELQMAYAPTNEDGERSFKPKRGEGAWGATRIYVAGRGVDAADPAAKDPTVEALGIRGHIYGARADLIVLDDAITMDNSADYDKQLDWLNQEVASRAKTGKILVVGTRVASVDLYSELLNGDNFVSGKSPWTYFAQPAVLEYADEPKDWVTLWPKSTQPLDEEGDEQPDEDGLYAAWDGPALSDVRESIKPRTWAMAYMQQSVADDATFDPKCIAGSTERRRKAGPLTAGSWGHPRNGQEGMHTVMSWDPAGTGKAFVLLYAFDRATQRRYVLNAWSQVNTTPAWYADMLEAAAGPYNIGTLVIEQNAYASWLIHDDRIRQFCASRGIRMVPHFTGRNKQDPDFGVPSLAPLLGSLQRIHEGAGRADHQKDNLVELPDPDSSPGVKTLIEQLISWQPKKLGKQLAMDGPMAWWFAELVVRQMLTGGQKRPTHLDNPYLSSGDRKQRVVVPMGQRYA